jgi:hypothetical protein
MMTSVGCSYLAPDGYAVELTGVGQNADRHFIDCFFDALYINRERGGCFLIQDCYEIHLQNSLIRTDVKEESDWRREARGGEFGKPDDDSRAPGAAVATATTGLKTNVIIEGSSLECPWIPGSRRVLDIASRTDCFFKHSSADSVRGNVIFQCGADSIQRNFPMV